MSMLKYGFLILVSFCASFALTPLVRLLALKIGAIDRPGARKIHRAPTPRLGGLAVVLAVVSTVLVAVAVEPVFGPIIRPHLGGWLPIMLGASLVFFVGVWDDLRPLPAWVKFLFQAAAASVAIVFSGPIERVSLLGGQALELGLLAIPVTFLWIIGITNAFNLIDGLDGLAAGLASIASGTCAALFLLRGDAPDAMLMVILFGALLGFLHFNFNPAQIFLGDSGSLVIGYILAVAAMTDSQKGATALAVVIPLLIFGLPVLDTLLSIVRRFIGGLRLIQPYKASFKAKVRAAQRMFQADQAHIHHRLIALGFSHRHAVLILYAVALGLSFMALLSVLAQYRNAGIILISVGLATYLGIRKLGYEELSFLRTDTLLRWYEQLAFNRLFFLGFFDMLLIAIAFWGAFLLKYEWPWPGAVKEWYLSSFPLVLMMQLGVFAVCGLYRGVWRAAGIADLIPVAFAVGVGVSLAYTVVQLSIPPAGASAFFCIDLLLLGSLMVGSRSVYRVLDYIRHRERRSDAGVLIYGAGRGGQLVLRELLQNAELGLRPIGFIDDDPRLQQRRINQVPVLGSSSELSMILASQPVASVVIASKKICGDRLQNVLALCQERQIPVLHASVKLEPLATNGQVAGIQKSRLSAADESPRGLSPAMDRNL